MLLRDALDLFKYWARTPPAFVSLHRIAQLLGFRPADDTTAPVAAPSRGLPLERADSPNYVRPKPSSREEVLAMQARLSGYAGRLA